MLISSQITFKSEVCCHICEEVQECTSQSLLCSGFVELSLKSPVSPEVPVSTTGAPMHVPEYMYPSIKHIQPGVQK